MARRYGSRRRYRRTQNYRRRRSYRRRRTATRAPRTLMTGGYPFGTRVKACLKYSSYDRVSVNSILGKNWQFRMNSLFDVDITYAGHQYLGFDQYMALFSKVRVYKFEITAWMHSSPGQCQWAVVPQNSVATAFTSMELACESPRAKRILTDGSQKQIFRRKFRIREIMGQSRTQFWDSDNNYHTSSTNPTESVDMTIYALPTADSTLLLTYTFRAYCVFYDPIQLGQS